jgi:hypothetical protein
VGRSDHDGSGSIPGQRETFILEGLGLFLEHGEKLDGALPWTHRVASPNDVVNGRLRRSRVRQAVQIRTRRARSGFVKGTRQPPHRGIIFVLIACAS